MTHPSILQAERRGLPEGHEPETFTIKRDVDLTGIDRCDICGDRQKGIHKAGYFIGICCLEDPIDAMVVLLDERGKA